jgi:lipopolysaccharide transport system ATP-binding protein
MHVDGAITEWVSNAAKSKLSNPYFDPSRFSLVDSNLNVISRTVGADENVGVLIKGNTEKVNDALTVGFAVYASSGELIFWTLHTDVEQNKWPAVKKGHNKLVAWLPKHFLNEGDYRIELILSIHFKEWISQPGVNAPSLQLSIRGGLSESPYWMMARPGLLGPIIKFESIE